MRRANKQENSCPRRTTTLVTLKDTRMNSSVTSKNLRVGPGKKSRESSALLVEAEAKNRSIFESPRRGRLMDSDLAACPCHFLRQLSDRSLDQVFVHHHGRFESLTNCLTPLDFSPLELLVAAMTVPDSSGANAAPCCRTSQTTMTVGQSLGSPWFVHFGLTPQLWPIFAL